MDLVNEPIEYLLIEVNQVRVLAPELMNIESSYGNTPNWGYAGYIIVNKTNQTQQWSPHFYAALGYKSNEIKSSFESLEKIMHPSDYIIIEKIFRDFNQNINSQFNLKLRYKTKSRTHIVLNSSVKLISNKRSQLHNN